MAIGLDSIGGTSKNVVKNAKADIVGGYDGEENHKLTVSEMPAHTHTQADGFRSDAYGESGDSKSASCRGYGPYTTGSTGGSSSHNNMRPWIACNFIMRY